MLRIFAASVLLLAFADSYLFDARIRKIWDDTDIAIKDLKVSIQEIQLLFSNMSDANGIVSYNAFDYWWGPRYDDTVEGTARLFSKWDVYKQNYSNNALTEQDLYMMFSLIDTSDPDSVGYLDYFREWYPYFNQTYYEIYIFGA